MTSQEYLTRVREARKEYRKVLVEAGKQAVLEVQQYLKNSNDIAEIRILSYTPSYMDGDICTRSTSSEVQFADSDDYTDLHYIPCDVQWAVHIGAAINILQDNIHEDVIPGVQQDDKNNDFEGGNIQVRITKDRVKVDGYDCGY
jgi:hypothetical protein